MCLGENSPVARVIVSTPIARPSRSIGTARSDRKPMTRANSRVISGTSGSVFTSRTCITLPSSTARAVSCPGPYAIGEPDRSLEDGVEDRLHVRRRARDHPQDLARGGLLLQRLLRLVEQAHV